MSTLRPPLQAKKGYLLDPFLAHHRENVLTLPQVQGKRQTDPAFPIRCAVG